VLALHWAVDSAGTTQLVIATFDKLAAARRR
jgi:hypothetical protein